MVDIDIFYNRPCFPRTPRFESLARRCRIEIWSLEVPCSEAFLDHNLYLQNKKSFSSKILKFPLTDDQMCRQSSFVQAKWPDSKIVNLTYAQDVKEDVVDIFDVDTLGNALH